MVYLRTARSLLKPFSRRTFATHTCVQQKHDEFTQKAQEDEQRSKAQRSKFDQEEDIQKQILDASLTFVPELGWSKEALYKGAESLGYPSVTGGIVEGNGPIDLVHHHVKRSNKKLDTLMSQQVEEMRGANQVLKAVPFVRKQTEVRLRMNKAYLSKWPEALGLMSLPQNGPQSLQYDLELMDSIWHHAGDRATDYNWYTKRLSLLAIYKSTELVMMQDNKNGDFDDTWKFLDRRFADAKDLSGLLSNGPQDVTKVVAAVSTTIRTLLGLPR